MFRNTFRQFTDTHLFCLPPSFAETKYSDERFDYLKPFILVAFPPLTLDHPIKTAGKETNKHISFIMKCDKRMFYEQSAFPPPPERKACNLNTACKDIPQASGQGKTIYRYQGVFMTSH